MRISDWSSDVCSSALLWVGRRISRPLRSLAVAARDFAPGDGDTPLEERGPGDVRDVIAAFNALRLRVTAMLDEKDRMLGALGHDLPTPLAGRSIVVGGQSVSGRVHRGSRRLHKKKK